MGQTLYLECDSGVSGDMTVAALLDLGADQEVLKKALGSLSVQGFQTIISRVKKSGLDVCDFHVKLDKAHENHDHDMEYLHGHAHEHECECGHEHNHEHHAQEQHEHGQREKAHAHEHHEEAHDHEHRGLPEILEIIDQADLSDRARKTAARIFQILAKAEAKAHGVPIEQVHFHEVGAVDSIVDIVAVAVCLDNLDITEVIVPFVCEGRGTVRCQHGILPVPVPAVVNIMEAFELPVRITEVEGELVTPTGAAIIAAVGTTKELPARFVIQKVGIGAGKRSYERPSLLRAMLIRERKQEGTQSETQPLECGKEDGEESVYKLETNIDDCTGEALGHVMGRLLDSGARDAHFIPVYMKKNRPGYELVVICDEQQVGKMEQIIFEETTTIGIRRTKMKRTTLKREFGSITLKEGELKVKKCTLPDGQVRCYPEYESAAELASNNGTSLWNVMESFNRECYFEK